MKNLSDSIAATVIASAATAAVAEELVNENTTTTAVIDAPAPEVTEATTTEATEAPVVNGEANPDAGTTTPAPDAGTPEQPQQPAPEAANPLAGLINEKGDFNYTREQLLDARHFVLAVKASSKQGGFSALTGRILREAVGYKFDSMDVIQVLKAMAEPAFIKQYADRLNAWHAASEARNSSPDTKKKNKNLFEAASKLALDTVAYNKLVRSLVILCIRNQDWHEKGQNINLSMNGHRAILDFFGITVTNTRRLKLSAN